MKEFKQGRLAIYRLLSSVLLTTALTFIYDFVSTQEIVHSIPGSQENYSARMRRVLSRAHAREKTRLVGVSREG